MFLVCWYCCFYVGVEMFFLVINILDKYLIIGDVIFVGDGKVNIIVKDDFYIFIRIVVVVICCVVIFGNSFYMSKFFIYDLVLSFWW